MSSLINKKNSPIWDHFKPVDEILAKCNICKSNLSYKTSVSNLRKHIISKHPTVQVSDNMTIIPRSNTNYPSANVDDAASPSIETTSNEITIIDSDTMENNAGSCSNTGQSGSTKAISNQKRKPELIQDTLHGFLPKKIKLTQKQQIDTKLMGLFTKDFQPFRVVEDDGFKEFVHALNPSYIMPDRKKISKTMIPAIFEKILFETKEIVANILKCSLTTDCWTSRNNESFLGVTIHFIDKTYHLRSCLLECISYNDDHTSLNLANKLREIIDKWGISNKIIVAVSDNAANIKSAIANYLKLTHFGCFAHTVNLITQDGLKSLAPLLEKIRKIVVHFKRSSSANNKFSSYQLNNCETGNNQKKIILDVATRWNSTYYMFERFFELKDAVKATVALIDKDLPVLTSEEWLTLENAIKVLKPFEAITKLVSGEKYLSASLVIILVNGLKNILPKIGAEITEQNSITESLITSLRSGVSQRLDDIENRTALCFSTFLDPRFKNIAFSNDIVAERVKKMVISAIASKIINTEDQTEVFETENVPEDFPSIWSLFDEKAAKLKPKGTVSSRAKVEVQRYIDEPLLPRNEDPLVWWSKNSQNYPNLSQLVREKSCAMATSVPCERLFSKAGLILNDRRTRLQSKQVERLLFINQNQNLCQGK